jgi:hypothetical protein
VSKHTPGPWFVAPNPWIKATHPDADKFVNNRFRFIATGDELLDACDETCEEIIAEMFDGPNQEANARLIASAPELLEALEHCLPILSEVVFQGLLVGFEMSPEEVKEKAIAAIRKAKGES